MAKSDTFRKTRPGPVAALATGPAPIAVAIFAIAIPRNALAANRAAVHKAGAFQASSPKTYTGSAFWGRPLFFALALRYSGYAVVTPNNNKNVRGVEPAGQTGSGAMQCGGWSAVPTAALPRLVYLGSDGDVAVDRRPKAMAIARRARDAGIAQW